MLPDRVFKWTGIRTLQLEQNHASMSRFGSSIKPLLEISQRL
jgi:hypothetical protein|nr:hypothetical protein [uncultured Acidovorax sp.]